MYVPCLRDEWQWVSLSLTAPSGIPGDIPVVFSHTKYRGSAWWINIIPLLLWEGSTLGTPTDINKQGMEGSRKGASFYAGALLGGFILRIQKDRGWDQGTDISVHWEL